MGFRFEEDLLRIADVISDAMEEEMGVFYFGVIFVISLFGFLREKGLGDGETIFEFHIILLPYNFVVTYQPINLTNLI